MNFANLGELRRKLLQLSPAAVARFTDLSPDRLNEIECGDPPTIYEAELLGNVYGLDPDLLMDEPIELDADDAVHALALLDEFQEVSAETKFAIIQAASAARDLVALKRRLGEADPWEAFKTSMRLARARADQTPFSQGRHYAAALRRKLGLGLKAIPSVRDLVSEAFPAAVVLYSDLKDPRLSGVTFADKARGPTIVLNLTGKNANPGVRRFSLAHELCHLLIDTDRKEPLATLSGFLSDEGLVREQRANAFAARLLCPEEIIRKLTPAKTEGLTAARTLIEKYGFHYQAARLYLRNTAGADLPLQPPSGLVAAELSSLWNLAEEPRGLQAFPLRCVPWVRRTDVALAASKLYAGGAIPRDHFARLLGATPADDVEAVLGYFNLDAPVSGDVPN